jgi:ATP-dependent helicase HrpB
MPIGLPIDEILPELVATLRRERCLVLRAPAGAGKTTRVPPALLDAGVAGDRQIVLLQPRRLAARAAAARISAERGTQLGQEIGYQVRFERRTSRATRIVSMTEGVFVRRMQEDPFLEEFGVVVLDEFHERSLDADLALALVRRVQNEVRPDLKIVVMSATLAAEPIAQYLGGCPTLESAGRTFPVEIRYAKHAQCEAVPLITAQAIEQLLPSTSGHLLAFLPGVGEIRRTAEVLNNVAGATVLELYADLPLERQQAVLDPSERRKIILATNVAETSLTIDGVTAVVDSGLARINRIDAALGVNRLELTRISKASADQRAGRAGRTAPGLCMRLWTEREQQMLADFELPEIVRVDLAGAALQLRAWGETDLRTFPWFERPPETALAQAESLLVLLGAVDKGRLTALGHQMARLPVHPRIARLMLEGARLGELKTASLVGALIAERDPFRSAGRDRSRRAAKHHSASDLLDRAQATAEFEGSKRKDTLLGTIDSGAARSVLRARDQFLRLLKDETIENNSSLDRGSSEDALLRAIFAAFPDRLARRREPRSLRAVMLGGRGVRLVESSAVDDELFVCVEVQELGQSESLVRQASAVRREWLPPDKLVTSTDVEFDAERERIVAIRRTRYEDLVIDEASTNVPAGVDASGTLAREAAARLDLQTLLDDESRNFLARWQCLAAWMPELQLPPLTAQPLVTLLPQLCTGCLSFAELRKAPILRVLKSSLVPHQLAAIEREAPERIEVPSGNCITLAYEAGKPPVLAVRIQEVFGLLQTPRVAAGRVAVVLHLLAPNHRPQQITTDLASFWKNTYSLVRGELRRRYPKHAWPEDPLTATAERRPRRHG